MLIFITPVIYENVNEKVGISMKKKLKGFKSDIFVRKTIKIPPFLKSVRLGKFTKLK